MVTFSFLFSLGTYVEYLGQVYQVKESKKGQLVCSTGIGVLSNVTISIDLEEQKRLENETISATDLFKSGMLNRNKPNICYLLVE